MKNTNVLIKYPENRKHWQNNFLSFGNHITMKTDTAKRYTAGKRNLARISLQINWLICVEPPLHQMPYPPGPSGVCNPSFFHSHRQSAMRCQRYSPISSVHIWNLHEVHLQLFFATVSASQQTHTVCYLDAKMIFCWYLMWDIFMYISLLVLPLCPFHINAWRMYWHNIRIRRMSPARIDFLAHTELQNPSHNMDEMRIHPQSIRPIVL